MRVPPDLQRAMEASHIDIPLSCQILERSSHPVAKESFHIANEDPRILDSQTTVSLPRISVLPRWEKLELPLTLQECSHREGDTLTFSKDALRRIGTLLFPRFSQGIFNGGSSTSYLDIKKNQDFQPEIFPRLQKYFSRAIDSYAHLPKALAPSFYYSDGREGPGFLAMKMRNIDLAYERYCRMAQEFQITPEPLAHPLFHMTSRFSAAPITKGMQLLREGSFISPRMKKVEILQRMQPLVSALTHSKYGLPRRFFTEAYGKTLNPLPLPGGHGQNFQILAPIYEQLQRQGVHYVTLGNIDNLGYTYDPATLAHFALSDAVAFFEFSPRTSLDKKGGILVMNAQNQLTCADLGVTAPASLADNAPSVLFNCALGWFKLDYLIKNLSRIIDYIPLRVSDQQKDAGDYAQGEYLTWESMALFHPASIIKVPKTQRFLAAKTLSETLIQSGIQEKTVLSHYPEAKILIKGMRQLLSSCYALSTS